MEFSVPQFIETAPKIVGPLTWKQFLLIGGAAVIVFLLYFIIKHLFVFLLVGIFFIGAASALAFLKIEGRTLPAVLTNFLSFYLSSKLYVWQRKKIKPKISLRKKRVGIKKEEIEKASLLTLGERSKLRDLSTQIEIRTK